jgi:hypothetical protein
MHTISVSIHEGKGQARALGYRGIKGIARGIRTIAGSMIMTVVEDHPMRQLVQLVGPYLHAEPSIWGGWSFDRAINGTGSVADHIDFNNRIETLLPPFNILVTYVSEGAQYSEFQTTTTDIRFAPVGATQTGPVENFNGGIGAHIPGAGLLLLGVEIIDSGIVTSVNDVVSEMSFSYICRDIKPLAKLDLTSIPSMTAPTEEQIREENFLKRLFGGGVNKFNRQQSRSAQQLQKDLREAGASQEEIDANLRAAGFDPSQVK